MVGDVEWLRCGQKIIFFTGHRPSYLTGLYRPLFFLRVYIDPFSFFYGSKSTFSLNHINTFTVDPQDSVASAAARRSRAPRSASAAFSCRHVTATSAAAIASAASPPPHGRRVVEERGRRGRRFAESHDAASAGAARGGDLELVDIGEEDGEVMVGRGRGRRRFRRRRSQLCVHSICGRSLA